VFWRIVWFFATLPVAFLSWRSIFQRKKGFVIMAFWTDRAVSRPMWSGAALAGTAMVIYSVHDLALKWFALGVHPLWVFWGAQIGSLVVSVAVLLGKHGAGAWRPIRVPPVLLRAVMGVATGIFGILGMVSIPLADSYTIVFLKPVLASLVALAWLGERPTRVQVGAMAVATVGVFVAFSPFGQSLTWGHASVLLAVVISSWGMALTRSITRSEAPEVVVVWTGVVGLGVSSVLLWWTGAVPVWPVVLQAGAMGTLLGVGMVLWVRALARAPVAEIAPLQYPQLLWGALAGWWVFGDVPSLGILLGGGLVACAGLLVLRAAARPPSAPAVVP